MKFFQTILNSHFLIQTLSSINTKINIYGNNYEKVLINKNNLYIYNNLNIPNRNWDEQDWNKYFLTCTSNKFLFMQKLIQTTGLHIDIDNYDCIKIKFDKIEYKRTFPWGNSLYHLYFYNSKIKIEHIT